MPFVSPHAPATLPTWQIPLHASAITWVQEALAVAIRGCAGVPEYWIVNLRERRIAIYRSPDRSHRRYAEVRVARDDETIDLVALPDTYVAVRDLLPHD